MDNMHPVMQEFLRPYRPPTQAEHQAMADVQARQRAEDQRRQDRALMEQQQHFRSVGALR